MNNIRISSPPYNSLSPISSVPLGVLRSCFQSEGRGDVGPKYTSCMAVCEGLSFKFINVINHSLQFQNYILIVLSHYHPQPFLIGLTTQQFNVLTNISRFLFWMFA